MANQEHIERLKEGIDSWNKWREESREIQPDLRKANLSGANLRRANLGGAFLKEAFLNKATLGGAGLLSGADLSEADLSAAILIDATLSRANLRGANLSKALMLDADLSTAILSGANLNMANLSRADLRGVDLSRANLSEANLSGAKLFITTIAKTDLRTTKGLTTIHHDGPSHIELFSVQLPQDGSALHFLRGAGVPDDWIDYYRTSMMHPIQYYSCFISYSSNDEIVAKRLHADLQAEGVRCWFAPHDMKIGDRIRQQIDEAIHLQEKLLLILSGRAIKSNWVGDEVEAAIEKEAQQKREMLFPIRIDESVIKTRQAWAAKLRRDRYIGDFTRWTEPQAYEEAFTRLLRDLKKTPQVTKRRN